MPAATHGWCLIWQRPLLLPVRRLMIEVHNNPAKAKCDGAQSLTPDQFDELMQFIGKEVEFFGKKLN